MYKIVAWDPEKIGLDWLDRNMNTELLELVDIVAMPGDTEGVSIELLMECSDAWDYLIVLTRHLYTQAKEVVKQCGIPDERVIYPLDAFNLCDHSEIAPKLFRNNPERRIAWATQKKYNDYVTCSVDGLSYIAPSGDNTIIANMYINNENWSKEDMEKFYYLAHRYYSFTENQLYFCDIGANIGTTSIYFKKHLDQSVKILAVEPVSQNYKLLKINMLLNDMNPEEELLLNCAVGEKNACSTIYLDATNCGGNSLVMKHSGKSEEILIRSFDSLIEEYHINPQMLKYLWVDVEGFELPFLLGAMKTLSELPVPIVMEILPDAVNSQGGIERYIDVLNQIYKGFIIMQEKAETVHSISDLKFIISQGPVDLFLIR